MLAPRVLAFSVLSVVVLAVFLYSTIIPQGPRLFSNLAGSTMKGSRPAEKARGAERFTPESACLPALRSSKTHLFVTDILQGFDFSTSKVSCSPQSSRWQTRNLHCFYLLVRIAQKNLGNQGARHQQWSINLDHERGEN